MTSRHVIAVDLGAESGRVIAVRYDGESLRVEDAHRFPNTPVKIRDTLYWDALRLWHEIKQGVDMALPGASSVGIDAWGVDFALLDRAGNLLANPVHYRDSRTDGMYDWVFARVPRREVFERTGIQFMILNTLYQMSSMVRDNHPLLDYASVAISIADLFNYWLCGYRGWEFTHATTTQMVNAQTQTWDTEMLAALGIPARILPEIVPVGTKVGEYQGVPVILPACHDTGSAVVAVPSTTPDYCYLSSGTWSLMGVEESAPIINDATYAANVTNEGGAYGTYRFLRNVMGLWIVQQCRATWREQGSDYDYDTLTRMATEAEPFRSLIDPDDAAFLRHGDMPGQIQEFCRKTRQPLPETPGQTIRAVYESLALKYRYTLEDLIRLTGRTISRMHVVGGGAKNAALCQMTADACNRTVIAGPVEATALGNAIAQFIALGEFANVGEARAMLSRSVGTVTYEPKHADSWEKAYQHFRTLLTTI